MGQHEQWDEHYHHKLNKNERFSSTFQGSEKGQGGQWPKCDDNHQEKMNSSNKFIIIHLV